MKLFRKLLAICTVITSFGVATLSVSAVDNGTVSYDLNNKTYIEKVDSLGDKMKMEEDFIEYLNSTRIPVGFSENGVDVTYYSPIVAKHIYGSIDSSASEIDLNKIAFTVEDENDEGGRTFTTTVWLWESSYRNNDELVEKYTVDEMNEFLKQQGFKAHLETEVNKRNGKIYYKMKYEDKSDENVVGAFLALNKEFGAVLEGYGLASSPEYFYDESTENTEVEESSEDTTNVTDETLNEENTVTDAAVEEKTDYSLESATATENVTATLRGDADLNNEVSLSDVIAVSKYTINSKTYPLANNTAIANADMNGDDVVDSLDTSALIEYNLGNR